MPLHDLVNYFNERFIEEYGAINPLLAYQHGIATAEYQALHFGSRLNPVIEPSSGKTISLDARIIQSWHQDKPEIKAQDSRTSVVNLDRLIRTVHILNFLPLAHENLSLFLPVSEDHVINIRKDHGAYFSDILFKCGLENRKVIITIKINHHSKANHQLILNGLRNYRERGYEIALTLDSRHPHGNDLLLHFVKKLVPDYIRMPVSLFKTQHTMDVFGRNGLLKTIRRLDTVAMIDQVHTLEDRRIAEANGIRLLTGDLEDLRFPAKESSTTHATGITVHGR